MNKIPKEKKKTYRKELIFSKGLSAEKPCVKIRFENFISSKTN